MRHRGVGVVLHDLVGPWRRVERRAAVDDVVVKMISGIDAAQDRGRHGRCISARGGRLDAVVGLDDGREPEPEHASPTGSSSRDLPSTRSRAGRRSALARPSRPAVCRCSTPRDRRRSPRCRADPPSATSPRRSAARCPRRCPRCREHRRRCSCATRRAGPGEACYSGLLRRACFGPADSVARRSAGCRDCRWEAERPRKSQSALSAIGCSPGSSVRRRIRRRRRSDTWLASSRLRSRHRERSCETGRGWRLCRRRPAAGIPARG